MTNKYLEKIAQSNHVLKGMISPAWQERAIAADHKKTVHQTTGETLGAHYGGHQRAALRGAVEGLAGGTGGALLGAGIGALTRHPEGAARGALIGGGAGLVGGNLHGTVKSYQNQGKEFHKKYSGDKK